MRGLFLDTILMAVVALLVFFYLGRELEAILVFMVGVFSLRRRR